MATLLPGDERPDPVRWFHDHHWHLATSTGVQAASRYGRIFTYSASAPRDGTTLLTARHVVGTVGNTGLTMSSAQQALVVP